MVEVNMTEVEAKFNEINILADFIEGRFKRLHNVRLMRVFSTGFVEVGKDGEKEPKPFPNPNYATWFECPKLGDPTFSILALPDIDKEYYETIQMPKVGFSENTYEIKMEDYICDLVVTETEWNVWRSLGDRGREKVLRNAYNPIRSVDPVTQRETIRRHGIRAVVVPATGDEAGVIDQILVHKEKVGAGQYADVAWEEVGDVGWIKRASVASGLGFPDKRLQTLAEMELERRGYVRSGDDWVLASETHTCEAMTQAGTQCKKEGVIEIDGKYYCPQHAKTVSPEIEVGAL